MPRPAIAGGITRIATRERHECGITPVRRIRSIHDEPAMIAPLATSPPLNAKLEKSPIMPSLLKYSRHQSASVVVAADTRMHPQSSSAAHSTHVSRGTAPSLRTGGSSARMCAARTPITGTVSRACPLIGPPITRAGETRV